MSLVAYGSSGESEDDSGVDDKETGDQKEISAVGHRMTQHASVTVTGPAKEESVALGRSLFSKLPPPKRATAMSFLPEDPLPKPATKKEPIKIVIPSLKEFKEEEEDETKHKIKRGPAKSGSGLMGLLPEPQNLSLKQSTKQLVPLSVSRKPNTLPAPPLAPVFSSSPTASSLTSAEDVVNTNSKTQDGNASDEENITDFFSLSNTEDTVSMTGKSEPSSESTLPDENYNFESESKQFSSSEREQYSGKLEDRPESNVGSSGVNYSATSDSNFQNPAQGPIYDSSYSQQHSEWNEDPPINSEISTLKNEALVRLAGKKRSNQESVEFLDVNGDDLVAGRNEWLLKSLSETDSYQPAPKRSDQPSAMHRRKHQITYLAFQAKAREQELKNQWSMNRMTKKQTQSKYGF